MVLSAIVSSSSWCDRNPNAAQTQSLHLPGFPRRTVGQVLARLRGIGNLVTPRVHSVVISTLFNRWVTKRRFQSYGECVLGCGGADEVEHYAACPRARKFARTRLNLDLRGDEALQCMMLAKIPGGQSDSIDVWRLLAIYAYCVYRTVNALRHGSVRDEIEVQRALQECLYEAVRGHASSLKLIGKRFAPS